MCIQSVYTILSKGVDQLSNKENDKQTKRLIYNTNNKTAFSLIDKIEIRDARYF